MKNHQSLVRYLLIAGGLICTVLGFIGVFIPVLPTTPFLLLASFLFVRSSKALHDWLMNHPLFGPYLTQYIKHHAVSRRAKISALVFLWLSLILSMILVSKPIVTAVLLLVGTGVSIHLLTLRTYVEPRTEVKNAKQITQASTNGENFLP